MYDYLEDKSNCQIMHCFIFCKSQCIFSKLPHLFASICPRFPPSSYDFVNIMNKYNLLSSVHKQYFLLTFCLLFFDLYIIGKKICTEVKTKKKVLFYEGIKLNGRPIMAVKDRLFYPCTTLSLEKRPKGLQKDFVDDSPFTLSTVDALALA